jgi:hypothetical protein
MLRRRPGGEPRRGRAIGDAGPVDEDALELGMVGQRSKHVGRGEQRRSDLGARRAGEQRRQCRRRRRDVGPTRQQPGDGRGVDRHGLEVAEDRDPLDRHLRRSERRVDADQQDPRPRHHPV